MTIYDDAVEAMASYPGTDFPGLLRAALPVIAQALRDEVPDWGQPKDYSRAFAHAADFVEGLGKATPDAATKSVPMTGKRVHCRDCGADLTGTDDGTGIAYCHNCGEGKDDEHLANERHPHER